MCIFIIYSIGTYCNKLTLGFSLTKDVSSETLFIDWCDKNGQFSTFTDFRLQSFLVVADFSAQGHRSNVKTTEYHRCSDGRPRCSTQWNGNIDHRHISGLRIHFIYNLFLDTDATNTKTIGCKGSYFYQCRMYHQTPR